MRRILRILVHSQPFFLLASLTIAVDFLYWLKPPNQRHFAFLSSCCLCVLEGGPRMYHPSVPWAVVLESNENLRVEDWYEYQDSLREGAVAMPGTPRARLLTIPQRDSMGLVAPIRLEYLHTMGIDTQEGPDFTPSELSQLRTMYVEFLKNRWGRRGDWNQHQADLLAAGDGKTIEYAWWAVVHDLVFVVLFVLCVISFRVQVVRPYLQNRASRRRSKALAAGRCPSCGYDIRSIREAGKARCPECASSLLDAIDSGVGSSSSRADSPEQT